MSPNEMKDIVFAAVSAVTVLWIAVLTFIVCMAHRKVESTNAKVSALRGSVNELGIDLRSHKHETHRQFRQLNEEVEAIRDAVFFGDEEDMDEDYEPEDDESPTDECPFCKAVEDGFFVHGGERFVVTRQSEMN